MANENLGLVVIDEDHSPWMRVADLLRGGCLGNHEFDEQIDGLIPFIRNLSFPVLAANLVLDNVPELKDESNLYKSIVLNVTGTNVGVIGYLTPDTKFLAPKNLVEYEDEVTALSQEVEKLKQSDVNIIIALGHSGFIKDLEIAEKVEGIDLVIGGHSNTFLWNGNFTDEIPEIPQGAYPTLVKQKSGRIVLVVQSYAYTKYMGMLHLIFDKNGEIIHYNGNSELLNHEIPEDPYILEKVNLYKTDIDRINSDVVGVSKVFLDGEQCRYRECNLGNFITDAILLYTRERYKKIEGISAAVIQGGRIRSSLDRPNKPFELTRGDWITVIPFADSLCVLTMNGTVLKQALEHSIESWRMIDAPGQFLQFSGIEVQYDLAQNPGSRVVKASAVCANHSVTQNIDDTCEYKIITSTFLANGGDGYIMFESLPKEIIPYNEITCILDYLHKYSPIEPITNNRITIINEDNIQNIPHDVIVVNKFLSSHTDKKRYNFKLIFLILLVGLIY